MIRYSLLFLLIICSNLYSQTNVDLQEYLLQREALMQTDSLDFLSRNTLLSVEEKLLNEKMKEYQRSMLEAYKAEHFFPPARNFYQSKSHIEANPFFDLIHRMPKGGILHLHDLAMTNVEWILDKAIHTPEIHVFWEEDNKSFLKGKMYAYKQGQAPQGFYPAKELDQRIPDFKEKLKALLTFDESIEGDSVDIWYEFEAIFERVYGFTYYKPVFAEYFYQGLKDHIEDNIQHIELRGRYDEHLYTLESSTTPHAEVMAIIREAYARARELDPEFSMSLIWANLRFLDKEFIEKDMFAALEAHKEDPDLIKGYDLVAEEDNGNPTLYHAAAFLKLKREIQNQKLDFNLYLHDGESSWMHVSNLYDAVLLGSKRIGHGFNLFRFPQLMKVVKEKDICIEVSPLSNQILGYVRDLRMHPASTYIRNGLEVVISSDDPQLFNYKGLSYDFWSAYMAWELDLATLRELCKNSIEHAALGPEEKAHAMKVWEHRWQNFVTDAIANWNITSNETYLRKRKSSEKE
ncbi:MAG: hypothetical protein R8P61_16495 [Bacteroidia bacterium]|nr:hypothetical protein [Bacteroidia bacterium]